jgi:hypothetical protein
MGFGGPVGSRASPDPTVYGRGQTMIVVEGLSVSQAPLMTTKSCLNRRKSDPEKSSFRRQQPFWNSARVPIRVLANSSRQRDCRRAALQLQTRDANRPFPFSPQGSGKACRATVPLDGSTPGQGNLAHYAFRAGRPVVWVPRRAGRALRPPCTPPCA